MGEDSLSNTEWKISERCSDQVNSQVQNDCDNESFGIMRSYPRGMPDLQLQQDLFKMKEMQLLVNFLILII